MYYYAQEHVYEASNFLFGWRTPKFEVDVETSFPVS